MTPIRAIIYINGVLFYPRALVYSVQVGGYHRFTVDMPAVKEWAILPPRSHGVVFFIDPVTTRWRLLCEGEYVGMSRSQTGEGTRALSLTFEGLHGVWKEVTYVNMASITVPGSHQEDPASLILLANANGQRIESTGQIATDIISMNALIDMTTSETTRFSGFLPHLIRRVTLQTPVDCFYMYARQWVRKMFALEDPDIGFIMDQRRAQDVLRNGTNQWGLGSNVTLADLVSLYESVALYQHIPIPAPPLYGTTVKAIPELMFLPQLYYTVPPACNVIFKDQCNTLSLERNFRAEITRMITQITTPLTETSIPILYMANSAGGDDMVRIASKPGSAGGLAVTHDFLSPEELDKGVIARHQSLPLETVILKPQAKGGGTADAPAEFTAYVEHATRQAFEIARAQAKVASLTMVFQPYLLPGFPCFVESAGGPIYGMIESVQHSLSAVGEPTTSVSITNVHQLYMVDGVNRTPYMPRWLNHAFYPDKIDATYVKLFGRNHLTLGSGTHAAAVPPSYIKTESNTRGFMRTNLDRVASMAIPVPTYTAGGLLLSSSAGDTVADWIRDAMPIPQIGFWQYQYRAGCSLSDYMEFHNMKQEWGIDAELENPPPDMSPEVVERLFASPKALRFVGMSNVPPDTGYLYDVPPTDATQYGAYELVNGLSGERQNLARMIQKAINRGATEN